MLRQAGRKLQSGLRSLSAAAAGKEETSMVNTGTLAAVGVAGSALFFALDAVKKKQAGHESFAVSDVIEVDSEEEVRRLKQEALNHGLMQAVSGAAVWGGTAALILGGLRAIEEPVFKSTALKRAGAPRLMYAVTIMATCGFAIKGETSLIRSARAPYRVRSSPADKH